MTDADQPKDNEDSNIPRRKGRWLFSGWDVKQQLLIPVAANLTTALLLFVVGVMVYNPVRHFLQGGLPRFPLYCVAEPYNVAGSNRVLVDLFVVNLTGAPQTDESLLRIVEEQAPETGLKPYVEVSLSAYADRGDRIVEIVQDSSANATEAVAEVLGTAPGRRFIAVKSIPRFAMLRFTVVTTTSRDVGSRSNYESSPIKCSTPYVHG